MRARQASWGGDVKRQPRGLRLPHLWLAARVGLWLCGLPIRWRVHNLPELLQHLAPAPGRAGRHDPLDVDQIVRIVRRMCQLRCFRTSLFPQACLRQALVLFYVLTRLGYPVAIHFGVYKVGEALRGHSWVTVEGRPVAERCQPGNLQAIYSFPTSGSHASQERPCMSGCS